MPKVLFQEVQHFRSNVLWTVLLLIPLLLFSTVLGWQLATGELVGTHPMSNWSLIILLILVLLPTQWAWRKVKLTTILDEEKISYGWNMPTGELNVINLKDIKEWKVIRYTFVGYGYRLSFKYGSVHNMSGNKGLFIVTDKGEKILIGTQRMEELAKVLSDLTQ